MLRVINILPIQQTCVHCTFKSLAWLFGTAFEISNKRKTKIEGEKGLILRVARNPKQIETLDKGLPKIKIKRLPNQSHDYLTK